MGFLDVLVFGAVPFSGSACAPSINYYQAMASVPYPYTPQYIERCKHNNCPMCQEENKKMIEAHEESERQIALKKQNYEKRCIDYMKRFRK